MNADERGFEPESIRVVPRLSAFLVTYPLVTNTNQ
jgi:hypothetical protein